jgi:hypothetical protein
MAKADRAGRCNGRDRYEDARPELTRERGGVPVGAHPAS